MKSKCTIAVFAALFSVTLSFAQNVDVHCPNCPFESRDQVYVFGNDVKLRAEPNTESKVLELLKIGEWVEIIEITEASWPFNGYDSPFYKVKYNNMSGYILGGLLSLEKKTVDGMDFFFAFSEEGDHSFLNIRNVIKGEYQEQKVLLSNTTIAIHTLNGRGLPDLDGILFVDYIAEACGEEGGGIYLFAHNNEFTKVAELSEVGDGGAFYRSEHFIFPDDQDGIPEKIIFKKEEGNDIDEEGEWLHTSMETWKLTWENGELVPNFRKDTRILKNRVHQ